MPMHFFEFIPIYEKLRRCPKVDNKPFNLNTIENLELKQQFIEALSHTNETPKTAREKEIGFRYYSRT